MWRVGFPGNKNIKKINSLLFIFWFFCANIGRSEMNMQYSKLIKNKTYDDDMNEKEKNKERESLSHIYHYGLNMHDDDVFLLFILLKNNNITSYWFYLLFSGLLRLIFFLINIFLQK